MKGKNHPSPPSLPSERKTEKKTEKLSGGQKQKSRERAVVGLQEGSGLGKGNQTISTHNGRVSELSAHLTEEGTGVPREEPPVYASGLDWLMDSFIHTPNTQSPVCPAPSSLRLPRTQERKHILST